MRWTTFSSVNPPPPAANTGHDFERPQPAQVCIGNMQHDLVVYRYVGWDAACPGEPSEPPDGLPFQR